MKRNVVGRNAALKIIIAVCLMGGEAAAFSNSPGSLTGRTTRDTSAGCAGGGCHGATTGVTVTISGPTTLNAGQLGTYTLTASKAALADGTKMGMVAASSDGTLANSAGMPTVLQGNEIIHAASAGALRTTTSSAATYTFTYTMPGGAAAGATHTLHATAALSFFGYNHASNFTVTTRPAAAATFTASNATATTVNLAWTGGGPNYRVVYKMGAVAPANESDGTVIDLGAVTSTLVTGLTPSTQYTFAVYSKLAGQSIFASSAPSASATTTAVASATRHVDAVTGVNAGTCTNPGSPCKTITYAMLQAVAGNPGDLVNVAPGTYNVALGEVFPITFKSGVRLVATGNPGNTIVDADGALAQDGILLVSGNTSPEARIEGFTFTNGLTLAENLDVALGGAIYVTGGGINTLTVTRNVFVANEARGYSGPSELNQTGGLAWGGAIAVFGSAVDITNNVFRANVARGGNGFSHPGTPKSGNENGGPGVGGAVYFAGTGKVTNNTFVGNTAVGGNGGISSTGPGDNGPGRSGGVDASGNPAPAISNNIFSGNAANSGTGTTVDPSSAGALGSGVAVVSNNLFFGNQVNELASSGDSLGTGSINANPLFHSAANFRLQPSSPAKGAGITSGAPTVDIEGTTRPVPPSIGAYESYAMVSALAALPASVDFGGQSMGTTSPAIAVTLTNGGGSAITVTSLTASSQFGVTHNCAALAAGASCVANVTFSPAATGGALNSTLAVAGTLTVATNEGAGPFVMNLAGLAEKSLVTHYYRSILRRAPDTGGVPYWESEAARVAGLGANVNETWYALAQGFFTSAEYLAFNRSDPGYVADLYATFFNRAPDQAGSDYWVGLMSQGMPREVVLVSFMISPEFAAFTQAIFGNTAARAEVDTVIDFYRGILSRLPDTQGFNYWVAQFRTAQCQGAAAVYAQVEAISNAYMNSPEYGARARTNAQFVGDIYNAFLRRGGDLAGVQYWIGQLATGARTRENERQAFISTPEFGARVQAIINQGCQQ
jgi:hypothetical protein